MRQFGRLRAFDPEELAAFLAGLNLGPDPLVVTPAEFHRRLTARKGRLKGVLLDQRTVAGLGNIYADESLFAAGLSPLRSAASVTAKESKRLLAEIKRILTGAIAARGSTTSSYQGLKGGGSFQRAHQAYGRAGQPCPKCGAPLERLTVAGRSTHHCPRCQPPARAESPGRPKKSGADA
jgi:formamidopyrimidine-DNA glycosylase